MALQDLALEEMTKPKNMRMPAREERIERFVQGAQAPMEANDLGAMQEHEGLSDAMQEKDYSSMVSPENARRLEETVKTELLRNPELSDQQKQEAVGNLSSSNILEFMDAMFQEAANMPDEEAGLMLPEQEAEAEMYIDEILGTGPGDSMQPLYDELDKFGMKGKMGSFLIRQNQERLRRQEAGEPSAMERLNQLGDPRDINFAPTGMNHGGPVKYYNMGGLASMGRMEDTELAHVAPGERIVPEWILGDKGEEMLDAAFIRSGLDPMEYTVGSGQGSINPMTGMPEYTSFFKRLLKKVKKVAPALGALVGFSYGGPMGAAIGKTIGGVIKTGDFDFQDALTDFGTGWALGNFATGMGMKGGVARGQGIGGMKTLFQGAGKGGIWGWGATAPTQPHTVSSTDTSGSIAAQYGISEADLMAANPNNPYPNVGDVINVPKAQGEGIGEFIQSAGAKLAGGLGAPGVSTSNINLVEQFKDLPMGQKLGVGALGLAALSQTGMFDKEQRGDVPENITQGMQGLENYVNEPLRAYNPQPVWGQNAPLINTPPIQSAVSPFMTTKPPSLSETLAELANNRIGLDFPTFSPG